MIDQQNQKTRTTNTPHQTNQSKILATLIIVFAIGLFMPSDAFAKVLAAPSLISTVASDGQVDLNWGNVKGAQGYIVRQGASSGTYGTDIVLGKVLTHSISGLTNGTTYYFVVAATAKNSLSPDSNELSVIPAAPPTGDGEGIITRNVWLNISGSAVSDLTSSANFPDNPDISDTLTIFEGPSGFGNSFGVQIHGLIHPPVTGNYTFWIAADDTAELHLSTDFDPAIKQLIASVPSKTKFRQWDKFAAQQSVSISLTAGQIYYIEALHKENRGGDHVSVAWQFPGGAQELIGGQYLSTFSGISLPDAPALNTAVADDAFVDLQWSAVTGVDGYKVRYGTSTGVYDTILDVGNVLGHTVISLTNGTTYYFSVNGYNIAGDGGNSNELSAVPIAPPSAPVLNTATSGDTQVDLDWSVVIGADGYKIQYGTASGTYDTTIDVANVTDHIVIGLTNDTVYFFIVNAYNIAGDGGNSNELSATPVAPPQPPLAPTLNSATSGDTIVNLNWSTVIDADGYKVRSGTASGVYDTTTDVGNVTDHVFNGTNGTTYYFAVAAYNVDGDSPDSNELSAAPQIILPVYTPDQCVNGTSSASSCHQGCSSVFSHTTAFDDIFDVDDPWVTAAVQSGWLEYEFTDPKVITKYTINPRAFAPGNPKNWTFEAFDDVSTQWVVLDSKVDQTLVFQVTSEYVFSNSNAYTRYRLNISANNGHVDVGLTEMEMMELASPGIPSVINDLQAESNDTSVTLTWSEPFDSGEPITSYEVQYGTVSSGLFDQIYVDDNIPGATIIGLTNNAFYQFRVVAVNSFGASDPSNVTTAILLGGTPISGNIAANTTWILAGSPYRVIGDVTVNAGVTLTIEAGGIVSFEGFYLINGLGPIIAQGTSVNPITFTSRKSTKAPGDWNYITLWDAASIFDHVVVEYADRGVYFPTNATNPALIQNSTIQFNNTGIYSEPRSGPDIFSNTITGNIDGIFVGCTGLGPCTPTINQNNIFGNLQNNLTTFNYGQNVSGFVINAQSNWWGSSDPIVIENTIFHNPDNASYPVVDFANYLNAAGGVAAPVLLNAVAGNAQVMLSWEALQAVDGYTIHYGTASGIYDTTIDAANVVNYTVTGLTNGVTYYFAATAYNASGDGDLSNELVSTPLDATFVPALISGPATWALANSPFVIVENVTVEPAAVLTIEPGVVVLIDGARLLDIQGAVIAQGTELSPITFRANRDIPLPGNWAGIKVSSSSVGSLFDYVSVAHAQTGITVESSSPSITNSVIENNQIGIHFIAGSVSIVNDSIIQNNSLYGIQVTANSASAPIPSFTGNAIELNGTYNLYTDFIGTHVDHSGITIMAENNWWGTDQADQIASSIWDNFDYNWRPLVDFSPFLGAEPDQSMLITNNSVTPRFFKPQVGPALVNYTLDTDANVTIKIYDYKTGNLVRTVLNSQARVAGAYSDPWDGRDDANQILPDAVYTYIIDAQTIDGKIGRYDAFSLMNQNTDLLNISVIPAGSVSLIKGESIQVNYDLNAPALVSMRQYGGFAEFLTEAIRDIGNHTEYWDGRDASGIVILPESGANIESKAMLLPESVIVIRSETLAIPTITFDPYIIRPLYNEVTEITYEINEAASVTVTVLSQDNTTVLNVLEQSTPKSAGIHTIPWDGRTSAGETIAEDGDYRVRIEAVDGFGQVIQKTGYIRVLF